ncbi:MAG: hypothetical protein HeimC2_28440 [Candidatus Heimdallarchaeota archaeon LC_2]|nr:MAG: hypothetical protein HeimC2_28440 [Candidatus Heimdallarchaeota archaeon LC_2]
MIEIIHQVNIEQIHIITLKMNWRVIIIVTSLLVYLLPPVGLLNDNNIIYKVSASGSLSSYEPYAISIGNEYHVYFEHDFFDIDVAWNEPFWITGQSNTWSEPKNINDEFGYVPLYQSPALTVELSDGYRIIYDDNTTLYWFTYSSDQSRDLSYNSRDYTNEIIDKIGISQSQLSGRMFKGSFRHIIQDNSTIAAILEITLITRNHDTISNIDLGPFLIFFDDLMNLSKIFSLSVYPNYPTQGVYFLSLSSNSPLLKTYNVLWVNQHENSQFSLTVEGDTISEWSELDIQLYSSDEWNFVYSVIGGNFLFLHNTNSNDQETIVRFVDLNKIENGVRFLNFPSFFSRYEIPAISILDNDKDEFLILWLTHNQLELWVYSQDADPELISVKENEFNLNLRAYTFPIIRTTQGWDLFWDQSVGDHTEIFTVHFDQSSSKNFNFNTITQITNTSEITGDYKSQSEQAFLGLNFISIFMVSMLIIVNRKKRNIR